jgi:hypothetical protein
MKNRKNRKRACKPKADSGADKSVARDKYLQRTYGITLAEFNKLNDVNGGNCWICWQPPKPGKNLSVDHDHKVAKETQSVRVSIRGILCFMCNRRLIGRRRREHAYLYKHAAGYLESNKAQEILGANG